MSLDIKQKIAGKEQKSRILRNIYIRNIKVHVTGNMTIDDDE